MGNNIKRVIYVGISVPEDMIFKDIGVDNYNEFHEWMDARDLDLNGHKPLIGEFGHIYDEGKHIKLGIIVDSGVEEHDVWTNLFDLFEKNKFEVTEHLRRCGVSVGEISIWVTDMMY